MTEPRKTLPLVREEATDPGVTRRGFVGLLGAAGAALAACSRGPREKIIPYVVQPPETTPGVPRWYATTMAVDGYGVGLLVESHEGRPTKVEGSPEHPASLGATGPHQQASVLALYDPDRARALTEHGIPRTWRAFLDALATPPPTGKQTCFLLEPTSSPLLAEWIARLRAAFPWAKVHFFSPLARSAAWAGARTAFGRPLETRLDLRRADVVVSLDADLFVTGPAPVAYARQFAERRRVYSPADTMNRLYIAEPVLSVTGMNADHRLRVRASDVPLLARALLAEVLAIARGAAPPDFVDAARPWRGGPFAHWVQVVARDLAAHPGACVVVAGDGQPREVHAAAHALNAVLGNVGKTLTYAEPIVFEAGEESHGLEPLVGALDAGLVDALVVLGGNPSYTAPADLALAQRIRHLRRSAYLGPYANETAEDCQWLVPEAHYLESWGDARAFDGTISLVQPLIAPLHDGRTAVEVLAAFMGAPTTDAHDLLVASWREKHPEGFDAFWEDALKRGQVPGTDATPATPTMAWSPIAHVLGALEPSGDALEVVFRPDTRVLDGRFANSRVLQELPDPVTKLSWGNAALVSRGLAANLDLRDGDVVELGVRGRGVRAPVMIVPGVADRVIALSMGYGRRGAESVAYDVGANAYALRTKAALYADEVIVRRVGGDYRFAIAQTEETSVGREHTARLTLDAYRANRTALAARNEIPETLYRLRPTGALQWGMVIDLNVCTGCNTCVVACQAENNVPVVGKVGVEKGRLMHWLRIDRYFEEGEAEHGVSVQPMLCQHCEKAPCEYVCPVNATVHSADGLNEMVYNRCVGTRFCSNNCPYKVRRFNWFNYTNDKTPDEQLAMNPDVTVRARGVMEKCTYCVQRIREGEIAARRTRRPLRDGEVQTACQQACPTRAIHFGSIADPNAEVSKLYTNDRTYQVLHELGTLPRTRYLARLSNPNPELGE